MLFTLHINTRENIFIKRFGICLIMYISDNMFMNNMSIDNNNEILI